MAASQKDEMGGRRRNDRRQRELSIPFTERRTDERRSGEDRRAEPRHS